MKPAVNCPIGRKNRSDCCIKPLEELFRARVITFLLDKGLLPPERARMLRGWVHSGFNFHRSRRVFLT